jgi:hypothetical protein
MTTHSATAALPLLRSTPPARQFAPAAAGILFWLAMTVLLAAPMTASRGLFDQATAQPVHPGAFAGTGYPVRAIEHDNNPVSTKGLGQVPCDGRAKSVSACWVFRPGRQGR